MGRFYGHVRVHKYVNPLGLGTYLNHSKVLVK